MLFMIDIINVYPSPDPHHKASNSAIHEDIWKLQLIMCYMKYPRSQLRAFLDISQNIVSFFSCCLQRFFFFLCFFVFFPATKTRVAAQLGYHISVWLTYGWTVARSRDNQNRLPHFLINGAPRAELRYNLLNAKIHIGETKGP